MRRVVWAGAARITGRQLIDGVQTKRSDEVDRREKRQAVKLFGDRRLLANHVGKMKGWSAGKRRGALDAHTRAAVAGRRRHSRAAAAVDILAAAPLTPPPRSPPGSPWR